MGHSVKRKFYSRGLPYFCTLRLPVKHLSRSQSSLTSQPKIHAGWPSRWTVKLSIEKTSIKAPSISSLFDALRACMASILIATNGRFLSLYSMWAPAAVEGGEFPACCMKDFFLTVCTTRRSHLMIPFTCPILVRLEADVAEIIIIALRFHWLSAHVNGFRLQHLSMVSKKTWLSVFMCVPHRSSVAQTFSTDTLKRVAVNQKILSQLTHNSAISN